MAPSGSSAYPRRTRTVLIVEDDRGAREATATLLREASYRVIEASDGVDGLERLGKESVDLVLLDLTMPRLDGRGFLEALANPPPVIVVSGFMDSDDADLAAYLGSKVFAFVRKPVPPQRLLAMVANATRSA